MTKFEETETRRILKKNLPMILAVLGIVFVTQIGGFMHRFESERWYRDFAGLTPYKDVKVDSQYLTEDGLAFSGELTKMRCYFNRLTAYVTFDDGRAKQRVAMLNANGDLITPSNGENRPASKLPESYGPWTILDGGEDPDGWEVYTRHVRCESSPYEQDNLFAKGKWENKGNTDVSP